MPPKWGALPGENCHSIPCTSTYKCMFNNHLPQGWNKYQCSFLAPKTLVPLSEQIMVGALHQLCRKSSVESPAETSRCSMCNHKNKDTNITFLHGHGHGRMGDGCRRAHVSRAHCFLLMNPMSRRSRGMLL